MDDQLQTAQDISEGLKAYAAMKPLDLWRKVAAIEQLMNRAADDDALNEKVFNAGAPLIADIVRRSGNLPGIIKALSKGPDFSRRVFDTAIEVVNTEDAAPVKKAYLLACLGRTLPFVPERVEEFIDISLPYIKTTVAIDVDTATLLIDTLMVAAGETPPLLSKVIRETLDVLPTLDPDGVREMAYSIMASSGEEAAGDRVYREFAISREDPATKWPTIIYDDAENNESRVSVGCYTGMADEFKAAVYGRYTAGTDTRIHYDAIIEAIETNAVARAREVAPSIMDIFNDRKLHRVDEADVPMSAPFPYTPPRQTHLTV